MKIKYSDSMHPCYLLRLLCLFLVNFLFFHSFKRSIWSRHRKLPILESQVFVQSTYRSIQFTHYNRLAKDWMRVDNLNMFVFIIYFVNNQINYFFLAKILIYNFFFSNFDGCKYLAYRMQQYSCTKIHFNYLVQITLTTSSCDFYDS